MIKEWIWFDLGYTLAYLNREKAYKEALAEFEIELPIDDIEKGFHFTDKLFMRESPGLFGRAKPETFMPWFIGRLNYYLGIQVDIAAIIKRWLEIRSKQPRQWEPFDTCLETLRALKSDGYRPGLISNWDETARPLLDELGFSDYLETIVISSEVGFEKPRLKFFIGAFELSGAKPEDCFYVGDNYYDDAVGSRAVGMDFCLINRFGSFGIEELEGCLVFPDLKALRKYLEEER